MAAIIPKEAQMEPVRPSPEVHTVVDECLFPNVEAGGSEDSAKSSNTEVPQSSSSSSSDVHANGGQRPAYKRQRVRIDRETEVDVEESNVAGDETGAADSP